MSVYTVFEPPLRGTQSVPDPLRFAFVRDGFHVWAFLLAPLWLLWHRLWLALLGYLAVTIGLELGVRLLTGSGGAMTAVGLPLALLVGFEAPTLRGRSLRWRGWKAAGLVSADSMEGAERRFFEAWTGSRTAAAGPPLGAAAVPVRTAVAPSVIGLFPEPGRSR